MSIPDRFIERTSPSRESDLRAERWLDQAEKDGCYECGGPIIVEPETVLCEDESCGWHRRIPWEQF